MIVTQNQIQFSEETMSRVLTQAILEGISEDEKSNIVAQAVVYLTKPQGNSYYDKKTPLQQAFESSMHTYVHKVVREFIEKDEAIKSMVDGELTKLLGQFGEKLRDDYELRNVVTEAVVSYYANRD
jgi:uncharacterized membrane-anchored protein YjiN (DUF445 family)